MWSDISFALRQTGAHTLNIVEVRFRILPRTTPLTCEVTDCGKHALFRMIVTENAKTKDTRAMCPTCASDVLIKVGEKREIDKLMLNSTYGKESE